MSVFSHSHPTPHRHPISCCGLSPGSFCFLRSPYWKTRRRWDDGNDIRTFARDRDQNGARFIFWKCSTMLARHPLSADLLNFGAKTIQINNSPNTFICDTGERNIPGLIDVLIIIFNQPNHHRTNQKLRIHFSELCTFGTSVSFFSSPFFVMLSSQLSRRPRVETLAA